jgi:hypothetical protein
MYLFYFLLFFLLIDRTSTLLQSETEAKDPTQLKKQKLNACKLVVEQIIIVKYVVPLIFAFDQKNTK